jgi:DNA-binding winged helix-turn-helix (wHTH) protein
VSCNEALVLERTVATLLTDVRIVVTRHELAEKVWGSDTFVDFEQGLNYAVRQIRSALEDAAEQPRFLENYLSEVIGSSPFPLNSCQ